MVTSLYLLAAMAAAEGPPASWAGPSFACQMTETGGAAFNIAGSFGIGRRFSAPTADLRSTWGYTFPDARIEDSQVGYSGRGMEARTSAQRTIDDTQFNLSIAYPRTADGMMLLIEGARRGTGTDASRRSAQLLNSRRGERIATGTCTLGPGARAANRAQEPL